MLTVKQESGRFYLQSHTGKDWVELPSSIKSLKDCKSYYRTNDVTMVNTAGESYNKIEVISYDGINLILKDETGTIKQEYLPDRSERELCDYLIGEGKKLGFNQTVVSFGTMKKNDPAKDQ